MSARVQLTPVEVSAQLKTNVIFVRKLIASYELPAHNIGGPGSLARYRIYQDDLDRWMQARKI